MAENPSLDEIILEQKKNCIFCKIISGEIPSFKVYEDDLVIAIMDINPTTAGHVLLMPKEHYFLISMVPLGVMAHMLKIAKYLGISIKKSVFCDRITMFIANGGVAGQQSHHFMMHIIPREDGDNFSNLDCIGSLEGDFNSLSLELGPYISSFLEQQDNDVVKQFLKYDSSSNSSDGTLNNNSTKIVPEAKATDEQKKKISKLFDENDEFKDLLLNRLDDLKDLISKSEKWSLLFNGIDVEALSQKLNELEASKNG